ncbi:MAG: hypothetical protein AUH05_13095 [Ktedonobacter sp. 13_2_20CM_53_11]|nr:MAG: hypothetical protein AUH05_13095 [Ktedonobacter sp. 13_2_20CM_53_11]
MAASITIVGLGPGEWHDLTLQAYAVLARAAAEGQTVYFRTLIHPTVERLRTEITELRCESFDHYYDESQNWETLYQQIAEKICTLAEAQPVIYAVPGHPLIGEASVQRVLTLARERGLSTSIVAGVSFLEPVCTVLELDPLEAGTQLFDATTLAALGDDEVAGKIIPTLPLLVGQVYNRRLASAVKLVLSEVYPDEWPVKLVRAAGVGDDETVVTLPLYELDRGTSLANHLSTLYVPPVDELTALRLPETLRYITMRLRREPDGCPWDRKQTHQSLTRYVIEETYEVVEALEENDMEKQGGEFAIGDVFEHVNAKLIRRHPHVFGEIEVSGSEQVLVNWEEIKKQERIAAGRDVKEESVLDGVPLAAPALIVAQEYQKRAARIGFEFSSVEDLLKKVQEEIRELQEATSPEHRREEMGDILFMVAKAALWLDIDAEEALRRANRKFRQRFQKVEEIIRQEERTIASYGDEEWGELWERAKR